MCNAQAGRHSRPPLGSRGGRFSPGDEEEDRWEAAGAYAAAEEEVEEAEGPARRPAGGPGRLAGRLGPRRVSPEATAGSSRVVQPVAGGTAKAAAAAAAQQQQPQQPRASSAKRSEASKAQEEAEDQRDEAAADRCLAIVVVDAVRGAGGEGRCLLRAGCWVAAAC